MTEELTLTVTDLERKAIAFCREKDVHFPIANYLVEFATEVTKEITIDQAIEVLMNHGKVFFENYEGKRFPISYIDEDEGKVIFKE